MAGSYSYKVHGAPPEHFYLGTPYEKGAHMLKEKDYSSHYEIYHI